MISEIVKKMIFYFDGDIKRINHALKVYAFSKTIGELEGLEKEKQFILEIAGVIHDIGIKISEEKYKSSIGKYQEIEGPREAEELLKEFNLKNNIIERVKFLIGNHHTYQNIDDIDFQILVEADFLVNVFEDNFTIDQIRKVQKNLFKTKSGIEILESMYKE